MLTDEQEAQLKIDEVYEDIRDGTVCTLAHIWRYPTGNVTVELKYRTFSRTMAASTFLDNYALRKPEHAD